MKYPDILLKKLIDFVIDKLIIQSSKLRATLKCIHMTIENSLFDLIRSLLSTETKGIEEENVFRKSTISLL